MVKLGAQCPDSHSFPSALPYPRQSEGNCANCELETLALSFAGPCWAVQHWCHTESQQLCFLQGAESCLGGSYQLVTGIKSQALPLYKVCLANVVGTLQTTGEGTDLGFGHCEEPSAREWLEESRTALSAQAPVTP